ncbi:MAG: hypothetical protein Q8P18_33280 [Pseudomonadota bacterium]|nr:hypothetical protein [Pseudomonadota bacterium]
MKITLEIDDVLSPRDAGRLERLLRLLENRDEPIQVDEEPAEPPRGDVFRGCEQLRSLVAAYQRGGLQADDLLHALTSNHDDINRYVVASGGFTRAVLGVLVYQAAEGDTAPDVVGAGGVIASSLLSIASALGFAVPPNWIR